MIVDDGGDFSASATACLNQLSIWGALSQTSMHLP